MSVLDDVAACRRFFDEKASPTKLRTRPQEGIVGPDFVHPTPSGHAFIACALLSLMKDAAERNGVGGYAGYTAATLAEKYEEAWTRTIEIVQQDVWVSDKLKP